MGSFDQSKAYAAQEEEGAFFDDGREIELLHFVYSHPNIDKIRGSPEGVLAAIDEYGRTKKYLMNVGEDKGRIVTDLIAEVKPKTMIELGGYVGYSCILFADAVRKAGGERYFSFERDPAFAAVIMSLVDLAGLSDLVKVVVGSSDEGIARLVASGQLKHVDLMFLDHYKPAYTTDLKLCEELGLITKGSVLAADNVIKPGNPPYLIALVCVPCCASLFCARTSRPPPLHVFSIIVGPWVDLLALFTTKIPLCGLVRKP